MSSNINQIYINNPSNNMSNLDLIYKGISPYGSTDDSAITWGDFLNNAIVGQSISGKLLQAYNINLQGLSNLSSVGTGAVFQTGIVGGVQTYHTPNGSVFSGTSFDTVTNAVNYGDQVDFSSASAKSISLTMGGHAVGVGFYFIVTNSGAGSINFTGSIYGPTSLPGGNGISQTPAAICSLVDIGNTAVWYINVLNGFNLIAGTNISLSYGSSGITINNTGMASFSYSVVTSTTQAMNSNKGYITNNASLVTLTLPSTFSVGDVFEVVGLGAGGWKIAQNAGQQINLGSKPTTLGATGFLASTNQYDVIKLVGVVANTTLECFPPQGNITVN